MTERHILVVDAGTSMVRALLYAESVNPVSSAATDWCYSVKTDGPALAREFDPDWLRGAIFELIASCVGEERSKIAAVSVTSQRQAVAFLDGSGSTVYIGPNTDLRAVFEGAAIDEEMGEAVYETTGHLPSLLLAPAKLKWYQSNQPKAYAKISRVLSLADWIALTLGGDAAAEATLACESGLLDLKSREWCDSLISDLGLLAAGVSLVESGTVVGKITSEAADATGLRLGTPVLVAGADTQCGLLGMGSVGAGFAGIVAGWSVPVQMVTSRPVLSPERMTWSGCFLDSSTWVLESTAGDAGHSYRWLSELLFGRAAFDEMDTLANKVELGSEGTSALLGHSKMDAARLGMQQGGLLFPVPLSVSELGRPQIVRSALETIAYAIRSNVEQIEQVAGIMAGGVAIGGGLTRSSTFVQIVANVLDKELTVARDPNVSAFGAYLCAKTGLGDFVSIAEAVKAQPALRTIEPDPMASTQYNDLYERWSKLSAQLAEITP